jgi:hypothetical protein
MERSAAFVTVARTTAPECMVILTAYMAYSACGVKKTRPSARAARRARSARISISDGVNSVFIFASMSADVLLMGATIGYAYTLSNR